jgi:Cu2+-exporting ATPase
MLTTYRFSLPDITCPSCVHPIETTLKAYEAVSIEEMVIDIVTKCITIYIDTDRANPNTRELLRDKIETLGIRCIDIGDSVTATPALSATPSNEINQHCLQQKKMIHSHWLKGILGSAFGVTLLAISICSGGIPPIAMYALVTISALLTLGLGVESYHEAGKKLIKTKTVTMDALFTVSTLTVVAVSIAGFFYPWLPMMCEAGPLIFGFRYIGKAIEESIKQKLTSALTFRERAPRTIEVINQDFVEIKQTSQLTAGNIIIVRGGQTIPVDGTCLTNASSVHDTVITGSTLPRSIKVGDKVLAGMTVVNDAQIILKVTSPEAISYLARLDEAMTQANMEKAPIENVTNKILQYFVPAVFGLAMVSGIVIGTLLTPALAIQCAIAVLVSACPCTLGFITPLAVKIGMAKAAEHGVQFKSSKTLQSAEQIDTVIFDLNGTLTTGKLSVDSYKIINENDLPPDEFLSYLAQLENESQHPFAKAVCHFVKEKNIQPRIPLTITAIDSSHHSGIQATINGKSFILGNENMMTTHGIDIKHLPPVQQQNAQHVVYLACEQTIIGYILLNDPIRDDAQETIAALKNMGKTVHICTGADKETAHCYAKQLGIPTDNVQSNSVSLPNYPGEMTKVSYIEALQHQGHRVTMVGDAANDAIAIAKSHFGIAIKSHAADEITQQQAGAIIQNNSLMPVITAFVVTKQTTRNIKQNLVMSLTYNMAVVLTAGGLSIAAGFVLNPGIGVALMVLQTTFILLNAYRFKQKTLPHLKQKEPLQNTKTPAFQNHHTISTSNHAI